MNETTRAPSPGCRKFRVSGRVQGVFFRVSTRSRAEQLGLTGYAINLSNGDVEVLACGDDAALKELEKWLWEGSAAARVAQVDAEPSLTDAPATFTTG